MTKDQQKKTEYKDWLISELLLELPKLKLEKLQNLQYTTLEQFYDCIGTRGLGKILETLSVKGNKDIEIHIWITQGLSQMKPQDYTRHNKRESAKLEFLGYNDQTRKEERERKKTPWDEKMNYYATLDYQQFKPLKNPNAK